MYIFKIKSSTKPDLESVIKRMFEEAKGHSLASRYAQELLDEIYSRIHSKDPGAVLRFIAKRCFWKITQANEDFWGLYTCRN